MVCPKLPYIYIIDEGETIDHSTKHLRTWMYSHSFEAVKFLFEFSPLRLIKTCDFISQNDKGILINTFPELLQYSNDFLLSRETVIF